MKRQFLLTKLRLYSSAIILSLASTVFAQNNVQKQENVTDNITLTTPTDLYLTSSSNVISGSVDISNVDAAIVFENVRPSVVLEEYADKITINGEKLQSGVNARVSIYRHGAIVLPHGNDYCPLTVYTEENYGGESNNSYKQNTYNISLGNFNNKIKSFKLKRGYMVTMATSSDGSGYSRVFIANDKDLEVPALQKELSGKVSFFRIFRWQWPSKKGYAGGDSQDNGLLNTTWFYTWGAGENARVDQEFVPQRHHETGTANNGEGAWEWPSWGEINGRDETVTHLLGQNEPDNTGVTAGEVNMTTDEIIAKWKPFLQSGMRIGTPATTNPNYWIPEFVNKCKAQNLRVDYVAVHWYKGGQNPNSFISDLKWLHDQTGLPIWITEWNNGANWTGEGGFPDASGKWYNWTGNMATDQANNAIWMKDVLELLDKAPYVERYAIYNAVEEKRYVVNYHQEPHYLTAAGQVYSDFKADFAYNPEYDVPLKWNYLAPSNITSTFDVAKFRNTIKWDNINGELTDSVWIERKVNNGEWEVINKYSSLELTSYSYQDELGETFKKGNYYYRVRNFDCDGVERYSDETMVNLSAAEGTSTLQYGHMSVPGTENTIGFFEGIENPAVFVGMVSLNNPTSCIINNLQSVKDGYFLFKYMPWAFGDNADMTKPENTDYMIISQGRNQYGEIEMEAGLTPRFSNTAVWVEFDTPFAEGVKPVVMANFYSTTNADPYSIKVYGVTNKGFYIKAARQEECTGTIPRLIAFYVAATPGSVEFTDGKILTVGTSTQRVDGRMARKIDFEDAEGNIYKLLNPVILAGPQTNNMDCPSFYRIDKYVTTDVTVNGEEKEAKTGMYVLRQKDETTTASLPNDLYLASGDSIGWIIVSDKHDQTVTAINDVKNNGKLSVYVENGRIYTTDGSEFKVYTVNGTQMQADAQLPSGIYIVRNRENSVKVLVP